MVCAAADAQMEVRFQTTLGARLLADEGLDARNFSSADIAEQSTGCESSRMA